MILVRRYTRVRFSGPRSQPKLTEHNRTKNTTAVQQRLGTGKYDWANDKSRSRPPCRFEINNCTFSSSRILLASTGLLRIYPVSSSHFLLEHTAGSDTYNNTRATTSIEAAILSESDISLYLQSFEQHPNHKMAIRPVTRSPLLLITLSICLALPILAVSSHILSVYRDEHASNPWWLPIWHAHFDTRGLVAITVTSCIIFALDLVSIGLVIAGNKTGNKVSVSLVLIEYSMLTRLQSKNVKWIVVTLMLATTIAALVAIIMPAIANAAAPSKSDTVQTWTCRWRNAVGAPENFGALCHESVHIPFDHLSLHRLT